MHREIIPEVLKAESWLAGGFRRAMLGLPWPQELDIYETLIVKICLKMEGFSTDSPSLEVWDLCNLNLSLTLSR